MQGCMGTTTATTSLKLIAYSLKLTTTARTTEALMHRGIETTTTSLELIA